MKKTFRVRNAAGIALLVATTSACTDNPLRPSHTQFVCHTQPRVYYNPVTGVSTLEIDTYTQEGPCPRVPIK